MGKLSLNGRIEKERLMIEKSLNMNRNAPSPNLLNHPKGRPTEPNRLFLTLFKRPLTPPPALVLNIYVADYIADYSAK